MHRRARIALVVVAMVLALPLGLVAGALGVAGSEWGEAKLEQLAAKALDREVDIEGISFAGELPPAVRFEKLRISNPSWAKTPNLVDAQGLEARVYLSPLFAGHVVIASLRARKATAGLEMDGERATWKFGPPKPRAEQQPSRLVLQRVYLDDGDIRFIDAGEATDLRIAAKGTAGSEGRLEARGEGRLRGQGVAVRANIPDLSTQHAAPLRFDGDATIGRTKLSARGSVEPDGKTIDATLSLAGATLKELSTISRLQLPDSPPYRLTGRLKHEGDAWSFNGFEGRIGDSDMAGDLTFTEREPRPLLQARLHAKKLDFNDLGPLIGAPPGTGPGETAAPEQKENAKAREVTERILPDKPIGTDAWAKMDADVTLDAQRILRPKQLPLESLRTRLVLRDSVLELQPLEFGVAGGRITAQVALDGRAKPMQGDIKADVKKLELSELFPTSGAMKDALGVLYGRTELKGQGASVAALLGSSNGKASFVVEGGRASELLMELAELDVAQVVMLLGKGGRQEPLRCAVSGFDVKGGLAKADSFVIDSEDTAIQVDGAINLADETLDLKATPNAKHASLVSLRTPLHLRGPLRKPRVRPEAGPLVRKGALAVGLAAINPALAVFSLYEPARGEDQPCGALIREAQAKGAAKAKAAS